MLTKFTFRCLKAKPNTYMDSSPRSFVPFILAQKRFFQPVNSQRPHAEWGAFTQLKQCTPLRQFLKMCVFTKNSKTRTQVESSHDAPMIHAFNLTQKDFFSQ